MILVLGRSGQLASSLSRYSNVKVLGRDEFDLNQPKDFNNILKRYSPQALINAAAYTDVENAESLPIQLQINSISLKLIAQLCSNQNIPLIHISTDYVFNGEKNEPYNESDPLDPLNAYGKSKALGEKYIQDFCQRSIILRTSGVFSSIGKNFLKSILVKATNENSIDVVSDQITGPTSANSLANVCMYFASNTHLIKKPTIYHYCGKPYVSWADFARKIIDIYGIDSKVKDVLSVDTKMIAKRPKFSMLDCSKIANEHNIEPCDWLTELKNLKR